MGINLQSNGLDIEKIRLLKIEDLQESIQVMAQAFFDDPLWQYLYKDEDKRKKYLYQFFKVMLRVAIDKHQAYGIGYPVKGVVIWESPDEEIGELSLHTKRELIQLGMSPFSLKIILVRDVFSKFSKVKKKYVTGSCYYLQSIGVSPLFQGKGYATKLIEPFIMKAKELGCEIYTETMTLENVGLYQHYGFNCMEKQHICKKNLDVWAFYMNFKHY